MSGVGESCRSECIEHLDRWRKIRHALGEISIRGRIGEPPSNTRNDSTEVDAVSEANDRIAGNADVEKRNTTAWSNHPRKFLEECRQIDEVSQCEATRCAIDTCRCNGKIENVGLTPRGTRSIGSEHAETEVDRNRLESCATEIDAQVSSSTGEVEDRAARCEPQFLDGETAPSNIETKSHDAVHQVVARCDGVEHRAYRAYLVVTFREALGVPGGLRRWTGSVFVGLRRRRVHPTEVRTRGARVKCRLAVFGHDGAE